MRLLSMHSRIEYDAVIGYVRCVSYEIGVCRNDHKLYVTLFTYMLRCILRTKAPVHPTVNTQARDISWQPTRPSLRKLKNRQST